MENNIGKLNAIFMQNLDNLYLSKKGIKIIKEYASLLKKNKPLLKEHLVFEYIQNKESCENLKDYITETINYLSNVNKKELLLLNNELANFMIKNKIEQLSEIKNEKLLEDIHESIFTNKSFKTINERINNINNTKIHY